MDKKRCLYCDDIIDMPGPFEGFCTTACYQKYKQRQQAEGKPLTAPSNKLPDIPISRPKTRNTLS